MGKEGSGLSGLGSSPLGSFQSLQSSQRSESDKIIPYVPPLEEVKKLWFEDTLSEKDHKNFNLILWIIVIGRESRKFNRYNIGDGISWKTSHMVTGHAWKVKAFDYQFWKV